MIPSDDDILRAHRAWLGMLQPVGVVVSPPALLAAQAVVDTNLTELRKRFDAIVLPPLVDGARTAAVPLHVPRFERLATTLLGWTDDDLVPLAQLPEALRVPIPEYGTELAPTFAVPVAPDLEDPARGEPGRWLALVQVLPLGWDLDHAHGAAHEGDVWHASPQARFERLLRETRVPLGILYNESSLRLVYQPVGEASGHVTFPVALLTQSQGAPCLGALVMLLHAERLFSGLPKQRLAAILRDSRKYQNEVSATLAEQVLDALWELLQGFRSADTAAGGALLRDVIERDRGAIYGGLLTVLLRLVFLLKAEDQGLLPSHPLYAQNYGVRGLFESLRDDLGRHPDAMDQRTHAWGRLLALFRLIHDGGSHGPVKLPERRGELFDPDAYPFLEGRAVGSLRQHGEVLNYPKVSDGVAYRVLAKLLVLDGEALSYRTLDVEQLGGVYESLMGFTVERVPGCAIAVTPHDVAVDLDALLRAKGSREKLLAGPIGGTVDAELAKKLEAASTVDELVAALGRRVSKRTPAKLPAGSLVLQPTEERRRSGSHYTPRALTEPIVRTTLDPVLARLGERPTPAQILALRVCDPAMGSGAFLVAVCRYLGDALVRAWAQHGRPTGEDAIPPDDDEVLHARRLVAQRCLYGVDRNPFAVSLARLSLWLVTMAKDHPFTFLDPLLRHGDSLVGLSLDQLRAFHWSVSSKEVQLDLLLDGALKTAVDLRGQIQAKAGSDDTLAKTRLHLDAESALADARLLGDLVVEAFFRAAKDKDREARRKSHHTAILAWRGGKLARTELAGLAQGLREGDATHRGVTPFHWPLAFPEVFTRENPGFDAMVGNPPFIGGTMISTANGGEYLEWITTVTPESGNRTDLVAYFFRRSFDLIRQGGHAGLIATNTIAQGDTRIAGLRWITRSGGVIIDAVRRLPWPGMAAVIVSRIIFSKGPTAQAEFSIDGEPVNRVSAWLMPGEDDDSPHQLDGSGGKSFEGFKIGGQGFLFADADDTTPISVMREISAKMPGFDHIVKPYIGGEDINTHPKHHSDRYVINFGTMSLEEASKYGPLLDIVRTKVKPSRDVAVRDSHRTRWWQFAEVRPGLVRATEGLAKFLVISRVTAQFAFAQIGADVAVSEKAIVFATESTGFFAVMQSRVHELWARFFSSSMKDDLQYTPSDCFETFPFPAGWEADAALEAIGREYHAVRADIMVANNEGLTKTYNRFHDPDEAGEDILRLRALHDRMDRAVLDAYGWQDLRPEPTFIAEHAESEEDADEAPRARKKKRSVRYRWPDADRDAVLAKLLALNAERASEERKARELAAQLAKVEKKLKGKKG